MLRLHNLTRSRSAQLKAALRGKLRKMFLAAAVVVAGAAPALAGPPCNCPAPCTSKPIDLNGDGIPDGAPSAGMDLDGDGIIDSAGTGGAVGDDYYQSQGTDLASSTETLAPNMIGDLLSSGGYYLAGGLIGSPSYVPIPIGGGDRRFKISENMSPLPRNRVYYSFNGFQQGTSTIEGRDLDLYRHTLGGEKTFWDGSASFEVRMPIIQGANAVQLDDDNLFNDDGVEFGNMTLIPKFIIGAGDSYILTAGLGINLPTARDTVIDDDLLIENQAVHLSPFLGLLLLPDDVTYVMSYVQADVDASGNSVYDGFGDFLGRYQDQTLMHFDIAVGRYLYRDYNTRLTGIAPQLELHYTTAVQDTDSVPFDPAPLVTNPFNRIDILTLTAGVNFEFWNASWLTVGCAVPLRGRQEIDPVTGSTANPERPFDVELQVLFNRYF